MTKTLLLLMLFATTLSHGQKQITTDCDFGVIYTNANKYNLRPLFAVKLFNGIDSLNLDGSLLITTNGYLGMELTEYNELSCNIGMEFILGRDEIIKPYVYLGTSIFGFKPIEKSFMFMPRIGLYVYDYKIFGTINWRSKTNIFGEKTPKAVFTLGISHNFKMK